MCLPLPLVKLDSEIFSLICSIKGNQVLLGARLQVLQNGGSLMFMSRVKNPVRARSPLTKCKKKIIQSGGRGIKTASLLLGKDHGLERLCAFWGSTSTETVGYWKMSLSWPGGWKVVKTWISWNTKEIYQGLGRLNYVIPKPQVQQCFWNSDQCKGELLNFDSTSFPISIPSVTLSGWDLPSLIK